jgi:hypothetical protein
LISKLLQPTEPDSSSSKPAHEFNSVEVLGPATSASFRPGGIGASEHDCDAATTFAGTSAACSAVDTGMVLDSEFRNTFAGGASWLKVKDDSMLGADTLLTGKSSHSSSVSTARDLSK